MAPEIEREDKGQIPKDAKSVRGDLLLPLSTVPITLVFTPALSNEPHSSIHFLVCHLPLSILISSIGWLLSIWFTTMFPTVEVCQ